MEDDPKLLKIGRSECSDIWIRLPCLKWPESWSSMEDPVVPLERHLYGHLLAGLLWERQFEKILLKYGWEKVSNWECLFVHCAKIFLSVYVDDIKLAGKKQIRANNVVFTKDKESVASDKQAGTVRKETIAVSGTIKVSVQNQSHSQLLLQNLRRRKMGKLGPMRKVPEAEVHLGEYIACRARVI